MKLPRTILAIDPGNVQSAIVEWSEGRIIEGGTGIFPNADALEMVRNFAEHTPYQTGSVIACEMIASYGMAVGASVFETCVWIGRFWETAERLRFRRIFRKDIKMHVCGSMRAKDGNIRQALIDRLGAPGTKKNPGATYGIKADLWAALAVAVTYDDLNPE